MGSDQHEVDQHDVFAMKTIVKKPVDFNCHEIPWDAIKLVGCNELVNFITVKSTSNIEKSWKPSHEIYWPMVESCEATSYVAGHLSEGLNTTTQWV